MSDFSPKLIDALKAFRLAAQRPHTCCPHPYHGVVHMVIPADHIVLKCCKCESMTTQHRDHWLEGVTSSW